MQKKRILSKEDKSKIIDLSARGFSRTYISKVMHMKKITLEKLCNENNIQLPCRGSFAYIKFNTSGILCIKKKNIYFNNLSQLYVLLRIEHIADEMSIIPYENTYKIIENNKITICTIDINKKATNEMIKNAVEKKIIKFMNPYYNKKFGI